MTRVFACFYKKITTSEPYTLRTLLQIFKEQWEDQKSQFIIRLAFSHIQVDFHFDRMQLKKTAFDMERLFTFLFYQ